MTTAIVLAAGRGTRVGGAFKPHLEVAGRRVIDRQAAYLDDIVIVKRSDYPDTPGFESFDFDGGGGPAAALHAVLTEYVDPYWSVIVAFADTLFQHRCPSDRDWVGVHRVAGGRTWDYFDGTWTRGYVQKRARVLAAIGLYHFLDVYALVEACEKAMAEGDEETSMAQVCNHYEEGRPLDLRYVPSWLDVGDPDAIARAEAVLA